MFRLKASKESVKQAIGLLLLLALCAQWISLTSYAGELASRPARGSAASSLPVDSAETTAAKGDSTGVAPAPTGATPNARARLSEGYGKLPLRFEINQGQTDAQVRFLVRGGGYSLFLTPTESVMVLSRPSRTRGAGRRAGADGAARQNVTDTSVVRTKLVGANAQPGVSGLEELPGKSNYFIGDDSAKWQVGVSSYAKVKYTNVYPGVDVIYYGNQGRLEHDFTIAPGADPRAI